MAAGLRAESEPQADRFVGAVGAGADRRRGDLGRRQGDRHRDELGGLVEAGRARRPVGGDAVGGAVGALPVGIVATVVGGVGGGEGGEEKEHGASGVGSCT